MTESSGLSIQSGVRSRKREGAFHSVFRLYERRHGSGAQSKTPAMVPSSARGQVRRLRRLGKLDTDRPGYQGLTRTLGGEALLPWLCLPSSIPSTGRDVAVRMAAGTMTVTGGRTTSAAGNARVPLLVVRVWAKLCRRAVSRYSSLKNILLAAVLTKRVVRMRGETLASCLG